MLKQLVRILIRDSSLTKFVFFLYYSRIIKVAIAAMATRNSRDTISGFGGNTLTSIRDNHLLRGSAGVQPSNFIANLEKNFLPTYKPLKIMPLGDSITDGVIGANDRSNGGYRTQLWNQFVADGLKAEFVGSQSTGPASLGSKNHEGHPGWTIGQIATSVNGWLNTYQPDIVLLMIGTNDTRKNSLKTMIYEFSDLIDQITVQSPDTRLLVASIPPIHPTAKSVISILRAKYFNTAIPGIINSKVAQGKKVDFVDMRSLTVDDLTSSLSPNLDNGCHPSAQGYRKIAKFWYDAVSEILATDLAKWRLAKHYLSPITSHKA